MRLWEGDPGGPRTGKENALCLEKRHAGEEETEKGGQQGVVESGSARATPILLKRETATAEAKEWIDRQLKLVSFSGRYRTGN